MNARGIGAEHRVALVWVAIGWKTGGQGGNGKQMAEIEYGYGPLSG
jgi:hypothetical protein